jgi:antitoxin PrlF
MFSSKLHADGRTTIPQSFRDSWALLAGTKLVWHLMPDGKMYVRVKNKSIIDLDGILSQTKRKAIPASRLGARPQLK